MCTFVGRRENKEIVKISRIHNHPIMYLPNFNGFVRDDSIGRFTGKITASFSGLISE